MSISDKSRRSFLRTFGAAVGFAALSPVPELYGKTRRKKLANIVFFLIDDLGWKDLSCYGSNFYETPAIDELAQDGLRFTQAYSAFPRCVPSRFSIMSGKFPARNGVPGRLYNLPREEVTIAEALKEGGYSTFFAGKWHLGKEGKPQWPYPDEQGFDVNIGGCELGAPPTYFYPYYSKKKGQIPGLEKGKEGEYLTDRLTDETIKFIKANKDNLFFVFLSHYAVHTPFEGKREYEKKYEKKLSMMPAPQAPAYVPEGVGFTKMRQDNTTYAAMIQSVDDSVRRIRQMLKDLQLGENTIIIFTSDNGGLSNRGDKERKLATSNIPLRAGKGWCYEGGIRVPLIVVWPEVIKPGATTDDIVVGPDFYPTLLEIAGLPLKPKQHLDGVSFKKTLLGEKRPVRKPVFWHSPVGRPHRTGDENCTVIRDGDYKLIDWYDKGRVELYNIRTDISEKHDLSKQMPGKTKELYKKLVAWRKEVNAYMK